MPYINDEERRTELVGTSVVAIPKDVCELNFVLTTGVLNYLKSQGLSYTSLNGVMGVLDCMKFEIFGRLLSHIETMALVQNGDLEGFKGFDTILRDQWIDIQKAQMEAEDAAAPKLEVVATQDEETEKLEDEVLAGLPRNPEELVND
jgi:hypothetical protein